MREIGGLLKILIWQTELFYDPLCTCSWNGLGCILALACCLYLILLIGWTASEARVVFLVYPSPFSALGALYTSCVLLCALL